MLWLRFDVGTLGGFARFPLVCQNCCADHEVGVHAPLLSHCCGDDGFLPVPVAGVWGTCTELSGGVDEHSSSGHTSHCCGPVKHQPGDWPGTPHVQQVWSEHGGRSWPGPPPRGVDPLRLGPQMDGMSHRGDPLPLRAPEWLYGSMGYVGTGGAGDFVLGIRQGEFFLCYPMCLYSKYSEFCGEFKTG